MVPSLFSSITRKERGDQKSKKRKKKLKKKKKNKIFIISMVCVAGSRTRIELVMSQARAPSLNNAITSYSLVLFGIYLSFYRLFFIPSLIFLNSFFFYKYFSLNFAPKKFFLLLILLLLFYSISASLFISYFFSSFFLRDFRPYQR